MKMAVLLVALSISSNALATPGTVYNKHCNKKEGYCSFSLITNEERKGPDIIEVTVSDRTTRDDRTNRIYSMDCRKRLAESHDYPRDLVYMDDLAYGGSYKEWVVDIRKAWHIVCKK